MAATYSIRLLNKTGAAGIVYYTVPTGKRCIASHVMARSEATAGGQVDLSTAGIWCYTWRVPDDKSGLNAAIRLVAYAGEKIGVSTSGSDMRVSLSGYLFDDPYGPPASTKPSEPDRAELPRPEPQDE